MTTSSNNKTSPSASSKGEAAKLSKRKSKASAAAAAKGHDATKKTLEKHRVRTGSDSKKQLQKTLDFPKKDAMVVDSPAAFVPFVPVNNHVAVSVPAKPPAIIGRHENTTNTVTPDKAGRADGSKEAEEESLSQDGKRKARETVDVPSPPKKTATEFQYFPKLLHCD